MNICPYLGKADDQATPISYASGFNACYRGKTVRVPVLSWQDSTCLATGYEQCPAFLDSLRYKEVPALHRPPSGRRIHWRTIFWLVILCLAIGLVIFWLWRNNALPFGEPPAVETDPGTTPLTITPAGIATPTSAKIPTLEPSHTPTADPGLLPTLTIQPLFKIELDIPFGTDIKFILHRVVSGESFFDLTENYRTSIEAIKWVNYSLEIPLKLDAMVIIPVDSRSADPKTPPFEPYQVAGADVTVEDLASLLSTDILQLIYYNNAQAQQVFSAGDWLIIPRQRD